MIRLESREVLLRRLAVQRLGGPGLRTATEVVRLLTCVQSQEYAHACWSLGMRTGDLGSADVQAEFDRGGFVRTHILRPTWHFFAAEDLRWIQALTSPRVQQLNGSQYRALQLTQDTLDRGTALMVEALADGNHRTRPELGAVLTDGGVAATGPRLAYLVMNAELDGVLCSGPLRGAQHTYALVSDRVPPTEPRSAEQALAELTWRFFRGHGPAGVKDLCRWSSLPVADARAGLDLARDRLQRVVVHDEELWMDPGAGEPAPDGSRALLVPLYDELTLSYLRLNFPVAPGHPHAPGEDQFIGNVLLDAVNVGTWRRTATRRRVRVEVALAPGVDAGGRAAVDQAVEALAAFLDLTLETAASGSLHSAGGSRGG